MAIQNYLPQIDILLDNVEHNGRQILFAVESGSRLWGMHSANSDYDVRFVYRRPLSEYLQVLSRSNDTISIVDKTYNIDAVGWDVKKFLTLAYKSNPSALEWLAADLIYRGANRRKQFSLFLDAINSRALFEHYYSMAISNYQKFSKDTQNIALKKYLYVLRGVINAQYVARYGAMPQPKITSVASEILPTDVLRKFRLLVDLKRTGKETTNLSTRVPALDEYIESFFAYIVDVREKIMEDHPLKRHIDSNTVNQLFRRSIGFTEE